MNNDLKIGKKETLEKIKEEFEYKKIVNSCWICEQTDDSDLIEKETTITSVIDKRKYKVFIDVLYCKLHNTLVRKNGICNKFS